MVMQLKSCCCGCSLKTGTVIIAVMSAIGSLAALVLYIIAASIISGQAQKELGLPDEELQKMNEGPGTGMQILFIILAIIVAVELIISILMIFGASSERANLVKPWIIFSVIATAVNGISQVVQIIIIFVAGGLMVGFLQLIFTAIGITIAVYFILVVNSFHNELLSNTFPNKV